MDKFPLVRWKWEIAKMFLYMSFPVAMFHYFNSPQIYESTLSIAKQETYMPRPVDRELKVMEIFDDVQKSRQLKNLEALESAVI